MNFLYLFFYNNFSFLNHAMVLCIPFSKSNSGLKSKSFTISSLSQSQFLQISSLYLSLFKVEGFPKRHESFSFISAKIFTNALGKTMVTVFLLSVFFTVEQYIVLNQLQSRPYRRFSISKHQKQVWKGRLHTKM